MNEEARKEFERYVYGLSHDLQGPLSKITTISEMLMIRLKDLEGQDKEYLLRMHESGKQLKRMIDDLAAAKLDSFKSLGTKDV